MLFVVLGQAAILIGWLRGWNSTRRPGLRIAHLGAIGVVVAQAWLGVVCPLTHIESELRQLAGEQGYAASFVGYWLGRLLYYNAPAWVFTLAYSLFGLLVLVTWIGYPPRRRPPASDGRR